MHDLEGKVVLVTGSSTGIGAAVAGAFARAGARVAVHYNRSREQAEAVAEDIRKDGAEVHLIGGDVTSSATARRIVAEAAGHFGRLDVLVNNAGGLVQRTMIADMSDEFFDAVMDLNVRSLVMACSEAVAQFRKQGAGNIINITSIAARNGGGPGASLYASAKGFVSTFTRSLAKELAKENIRVNAVAPGVIMTPFHERHSTPQMLQAFKSTIPMSRIGDPDECAGAMLFLASDVLSGYVTGQIIEVNGGQYMP